MKLLSLAFAGIAASAWCQAPLSSTEAVQRAVDVSPVLRARAAGVDAAKARRRMALSEFRPQISLNGIGAVGNGAMVFPTTVMPFGYPMVPGNGVAVANGTMMWKLFTSGRGRFVDRAGRAQTASAEHDLFAAKLETSLRARLAFSDALLRAEIVASSEAALESAREMLRVTQERVKSGAAPEAFELRAVAETARMEKDLAMARADAEMALAMLREVLAVPQTDSIEVGVWNEELIAPGSLKEALALSKVRRPEPESARQRALAFALKAKSDRASSGPEVSLMAMADSMGQRGMRQETGSKAGIVVSFPLLDGGERGAKAEENRSMSVMAESDLQMEDLRVAAEVSSAWSVWLSVGPVRDAARTELVASEESYRVALVRYQEGRSTLSELIDARTQMTTARTGVAEAEAHARSAWSRLQRATGA